MEQVNEKSGLSGSVTYNNFRKRKVIVFLPLRFRCLYRITPKYYEHVNFVDDELGGLSVRLVYNDFCSENRYTLNDRKLNININIFPLPIRSN